MLFWYFVYFPLTFLFYHTEKIISSDALEGVPILVLANKQDVEVNREKGS